MRALFIALCFTSPAASLAAPKTTQPSDVRTPTTPSKAAQLNIMSLIGNTTGYYLDFQIAQSKERQRRLAILEGGSRDYRGWQNSDIALKAAERKLNEEFAEVTRATEEAYHVGPDRRKGWVTGGLFDGRRASWKPKLQLGAVAYEVSLSKTETVYMVASDDPKKAAGTLNDGTVLVSMRLLARAVQNGSPAVVAATLEHEGHHFDRLTGPGLIGRDSSEYYAYKREAEIADAIGLEGHEKMGAEDQMWGLWGSVSAKEIAASASGQPYKAAPGSGDYPYLMAADQNIDIWRKIKGPLDTIRGEQAELSSRIARIDRGESPDQWRDSLNDRQPPDGATSSDGCSGTGFWAGDVYVPAMPCQRVLPPTADTSAVPAPSPPLVQPATPPPPVRAVPSLSGLAERICADPSASHSQPFHDDYAAAWFSSSQDAAAMPKCPREVFQVLVRIRQQGSPDYNSDYFQALAENLNMPQPPVFTPPESDVDLPVPPGPSVPDCMRREGRRCIRWRR